MLWTSGVRGGAEELACSNLPRGFEGNIGGAAKRTYVNGLWEDKTLPSVWVWSKKRLATSLRTYWAHPCLLYNISRTWLCPGNSSGNKSKRQMDIWAQCRGGKMHVYTYTCKRVKTPLGECWHGEARVHHMFALLWWPRGSDGLRKVGEFRRGQYFEFKSRSRNLLREKKNL